MTDQITGKINNLSIQEKGTDKERHGVKVDGDWYNKFGKPGEYSEGDKVKIEFSTNDYGYQIEEIDIVEESGASEADESREGDTKANDSSIGEKYTGSDNYISPEIQVALKKAVDTALEADLDLDNDRQRAEHIELVKSLTNGYFNILKDIAGDDA